MNKSLKSIVQVDFPPFEYQLKQVGGNTYIFDFIRKKHVALTPEEWVRQHLVNYLVEVKNYPKSLIKLESGLVYNNLAKRSDVVVFDRHGDVFLTVECKAAHIKLNQSTIDQVAVYNTKYKSKFLAITNGLKHFVFEMDYQHGRFNLHNEFPDF